VPFEGPERRLRTRFRVRIPFILTNGPQQIQGTTRNVSLLGISAYSSGSFPLAQPVQCLLELPQEPKPVVAKGTVIHCEPVSQPHSDGSYEIGIFFKEFEESGESTLARYLEQISSKEETTLKAGYRALKKKLAARRRRKRTEALRKRRRHQQRLRRRRQRVKKLAKRVAKK